MVINFGPQHPATHGTLRLVLHLEGERVRKVEPEIGFLHTGFEKLGESRTYNQFIVTTDRMNYMSAMCNNVGYAIAVEDLLGIAVPVRGQLIRLIMCELSRISDHILSVGLQAMDLGAFSVMLWAFIEREKLYDIFELTSGGRLTTSYTRVGGLAYDAPDDFVPRIRAFLSRLEPLLADMEGALSHNRIFLDRTKGIGVLSKSDAIAFGVTGPLARASGVDRDLRRDRPYSSYEELAFEVPVLTDGDVYTRYLIRMAEVRQAAQIVEQALDRLPSGPVNALAGKVTLPEKDDIYSKMESLIHHFMLSMPGHGHKTPEGDIYSATESPNGELGWLLVGDGTTVPYRLRCRPPSFYNYQAITRMITGSYVSDVVSCLGSLNVIAGELDR
ncbi:NADH-quinone oxidoreductase subunit D [bacterium]|nr:NADH-quinone oxidoreductase subunit D [bacterium]